MNKKLLILFGAVVLTSCNIDMKLISRDQQIEFSMGLFPSDFYTVTPQK